MAPTLREGDWLLVDPDAFDGRPPRAGDLALVEIAPGRLAVKRVAAVDDDAGLALVGDAPDEPGHAHGAGPLPAAALRGRPWFRYRPLRRFGRVR